jgi:hypothetical protein
VGNGGLIKDASGNVGVGVTPSAWGGTLKGLDISTMGGVGGAPTASFVGCNLYNNGTNWIYKSTAAAALYYQNAGQHVWYNAASGTGGNTISLTQAMTLDASGRLLVGRTSLYSANTGCCISAGGTAATLDIVSSQASSPQGLYVEYSAVSNGSGGQFISCYDLNALRFSVAGNGNVTNVNNSYGPISDIKVKENITDATPKLAGLMQVRVVNYNLKGELGYETHKQIGVIAQELEQVFPGLVHETPDQDKDGNDLGTTTKGVKMSVFVPMLIKAIQEQQALITTLTDRITALENK